MRIAKLYIIITALFLSLESHSEIKVASQTASTITLNGSVSDSDFRYSWTRVTDRRIQVLINSENDVYFKTLNTTCKKNISPATDLNELLSSGLKLPYNHKLFGTAWYVTIICSADGEGYTWIFLNNKITPPDSNCSINVSAVNFGTIPYNEKGIVTTIPVSLSCNKAFSAKLEFRPESLKMGVIPIDDAKVAPYFDNGKTTVTLSSTSGFETVSLNFRLTDTGKKMGIKKGSVVLLASFE